MKHNWEYKRLGDVATYVNGYAFKPTDWIESGYPIIRIQNLNNSDAIYNYSNGNIPSKYFVSDGDLLISWSASLGAYIWHGEKAVLNQHIFKVIFDKTDIIKNYLKYFVDFSLPLMASKTHGATMRHITKPSFDALPIPFPKLEVQERIVAELDKINETIEDCRELLRNLDALAQSLFYDTFGDPITNPKKWQIKKIKEIGKVITGSTPSTKVEDYYNSHDICFVKPGDIDNSISYISDTKDYISNFAFDSCCRKLPMGTVVVTCIGIIGKVGVLKVEANCNQQINAVIPFDAINNIYLAYILKEYAPLFTDAATGPVVKILNKSSFSEFSIPVPPLELQEKFAARIEQIEEQKKSVEQTIAELQTLLDSRMDYWFN